MKAKELERLIFNPYHTSKILHYFLSGANNVDKKGIKTELIYLVLPLIYNEDICGKLSRMNKNSKLNTFINDKENQLFISLINQKIRDYKTASKQGILFLSNTSKMEFNTHISIEVELTYGKIQDPVIKQICKGAYNLGMIVAKERYVDVFLKMRIFEI